MINKSIRLIGALIAIIGMSSTTGAAQQGCDERARLREIAPNVFLRQGVHAPVFEASNVANIGFIVGEQCVAVIDAGGSLDEGKALHCAIKARTALPVCYIILTHVHPDHSLGAAALRNSKTIIIGHAKLKRAITLLGEYYLTRLRELAGQSMSMADLPMPERTVDPGQSLSLNLGQRKIVLRAHVTAHTDNDLSVYDETSQTLWAGDLVFLEHTPAVDGSSQGWLRVLDTLSAIDARRVVPGHGPVREDWPQAAEPTRHYLEQLRQELRDWIGQGGDMLSAQQHIGRSLRAHWLLFDEYHKRNISKIYTEIEWE